MADLNGFNANDVDPDSALAPVPANKYLAAVTESEMKPTKDGKGRYLQLTFQILDGEFKGRQIWARLNLENSNITAVNIARAQLSALCRAVGVMVPKDSVELHNLPVLITVVCKKRKDSDEMQNEIRGFAKKDAASQVQQAATSVPPWKR